MDVHTPHDTPTTALLAAPGTARFVVVDPDARRPAPRPLTGTVAATQT